MACQAAARQHEDVRGGLDLLWLIGAPSAPTQRPRSAGVAQRQRRKVQKQEGPSVPAAFAPSALCHAAGLHDAAISEGLLVATTTSSQGAAAATAAEDDQEPEDVAPSSYGNEDFLLRPAGLPARWPEAPPERPCEFHTAVHNMLDLQETGIRAPEGETLQAAVLGLEGYLETLPVTTVAATFVRPASAGCQHPPMRFGGRPMSGQQRDREHLAQRPAHWPPEADETAATAVLRQTSAPDRVKSAKSGAGESVRPRFWTQDSAVSEAAALAENVAERANASRGVQLDSRRITFSDGVTDEEAEALGVMMETKTKRRGEKRVTRMKGSTNRTHPRILDILPVWAQHPSVRADLGAEGLPSAARAAKLAASLAAGWRPTTLTTALTQSKQTEVSDAKSAPGVREDENCRLALESHVDEASDLLVGLVKRSALARVADRKQAGFVDAQAEKLAAAQAAKGPAQLVDKFGDPIPSSSDTVGLLRIEPQDSLLPPPPSSPKRAVQVSVGAHVRSSITSPAAPVAHGASRRNSGVKGRASVGVRARGRESQAVPRSKPTLKAKKSKLEEGVNAFVTIIRASHLLGRSLADGEPHPDLYCICDVPGKRDSRVQTKSVPSEAFPTWHEHFKLAHYETGDPLIFSLCLNDKEMEKDGEHLAGRAVLPAKRFESNPFRGKLELQSKGTMVGYLEIEAKIIDKMEDTIGCHSSLAVQIENRYQMTLREAAKAHARKVEFLSTITEDGRRPSVDFS
eukprot:TRINITY_DN32866_c0_g1_i1.p1 TRINITY_DN32866_c0_g1~~TRINITY_DN32866_c0_g1_i1.p1  ORF type:complete len:744 (+),score=164.19 TRINITY_DN32866_c0_g1_i1:94-2325(+)